MSIALVTGGAGFIGSHLIDLLLERGERVRVLDNLDPLAHPDGESGRLSKAAELIVGDVADPDAVARALDGVDRVYHLAGIVGNGESMVNVRRSVEANSVGTATLLEAVIERREEIRRVVVASSMVVYGEGAYRCAEHGVLSPAPRSRAQLERREWEPRCAACGRELEPIAVREDMPLRPMSVYGITKRDQEELALVLAEAYGFEAVALRYLNTYGPGQALGNPYTGVGAIFAARILNGRAPRIFEDGAQIRDLIHVSDTARATALAMDAEGAPGHALNVATGRAVTVLELAEALAEALGSDLRSEVTGEYRAGDIRHCLADTTAAHELLGFDARKVREDGLAELARWVATQTVEERGDQAAAELRARGLIG